METIGILLLIIATITPILTIALAWKKLNNIAKVYRVIIGLSIGFMLSLILYYGGFIFLFWNGIRQD